MKLIPWGCYYQPYSYIYISNNRAVIGGGLYLYQSELFCKKTLTLMKILLIPVVVGYIHQCHSESLDYHTKDHWSMYETMLNLEGVFS